MISESVFPFEMVLESKDMSHEPEIFSGLNEGMNKKIMAQKR